MRTVSSTFRVITLLMAFLVFITSVGFTLDLHYCKGNLKSFSFIGKAKSCHELAGGEPVKACHLHFKKVSESNTCKVSQKKCCENKTLRFQSTSSQLPLQTSFALDKTQQQFLIAYISIKLEDNLVKESRTNTFPYKPPLIPRDIPVFCQSFLL